jgi:hypothetical protein
VLLAVAYLGQWSLNFSLSLHAGAFFVGFGGGVWSGFKCFKWFKYFSGGAYIFSVLEGFGGFGVKLTR